MDSSVSGSARAASSYISSGKIIAFEYFWHILPIIFSEWLKLIVANAEQFGILSIVTALAVRFLFYEDWEENYRIRKTYIKELERESEMSESDSVSVDTNTSERLVLQREVEYYLENLDQLSGHITATRWTGLPIPQV